MRETKSSCIIGFLFILFVVILGISMFIEPAKNGVARAATEPQELSIGNSTFIPLKEDFSAVPAQKKLVMETVRKFEKAHPELVVLCWNVNYTVGSMNVVIDGVYIYHKLK